MLKKRLLTECKAYNNNLFSIYDEPNATILKRAPLNFSQELLTHTHTHTTHTHNVSTFRLDMFQLFS